MLAAATPDAPQEGLIAAAAAAAAASAGTSTPPAARSEVQARTGLPMQSLPQL
jgi:hypothetical protein